MGFEAERLAIEKRLGDNWLTTPIAFENVPFDPKDGEAYIELIIVDGPSTQISLGSGVAALHRSTSTISIGIYLPMSTGTKTGRGYADTLSALFRNWVDTTSGIHCKSPSIYRIGEDSGWYRYNVLIPFYMDVSFP